MHLKARYRNPAKSGTTALPRKNWLKCSSNGSVMSPVTPTRTLAPSILPSSILRGHVLGLALCNPRVAEDREGEEEVKRDRRRKREEEKVSFRKPANLDGCTHISF